MRYNTPVQMLNNTHMKQKGSPSTCRIPARCLALLVAGSTSAMATDPFAEIERLEQEQRRILDRLDAQTGADTEPASMSRPTTGIESRADGAPTFTGRIAFGRHGRLYVLEGPDPMPRRIENLPPRAYDPSFSTDGRRLVFGDGTLHVYDFDRRTSKHLIDGPKFAKFHPSGGNTLVYGVPGRGLYLHSIEQDTVVQLLDNTLKPFQPAWHPDGEHVVFVGQPPDDTNRYLYSITTDCIGRRDCNQEVRRLVHDGRFNHAPAWSPDGRTIAFSRMASNDGNWTATLLDVASGRLRAITPAGANDHHPLWMDDGMHLIVLRDDPDVSGLKNLHVIDREGNSLMQLTRDGANGPAYHPGGR